MSEPSAKAARAPKKTSDTNTTEEESALKLNKSIQDVTKKIGGLQESFVDMKEFSQNVLTDFDHKIEFKKRKIEQMEDDFRLECKSKEIQLSNVIREQGYKAAVEILQARNPKEVPVAESDLLALRNRVAQLEKEMKDGIAGEVAKHKQALEKDFRYNEETSKLRASAEMSKITAELSQKLSHIAVLEEQIVACKHEIDAQRNLTLNISNAFSNAQKPQIFGDGQGNSSSKSAARR